VAVYYVSTFGVGVKHGDPLPPLKSGLPGSTNLLALRVAADSPRA
jgi:hypothetical protein